MKSFSFVVVRIRLGNFFKLKTEMGSDYGGQPREDYQEMQKFFPYPKRKEGDKFKITYTMNKNGGFIIAGRNERGTMTFRYETIKSYSDLFINCLAPKKLDWVVGTRFNRKVKVVNEI